MVKRPTLILLLILGLIIIAYVLLNRQASLTKQDTTPTEQGSDLLISAEEGLLQSVHISSSNGQSFQMQRDTSGAWIITLPSAGIADQSLAGAAETQVGALRIISRIENHNNLKDYGLSEPSETLEFTYSSGRQRVFRVGSLTPTNSGYYLLDDKENLLVVSKAGIDAMLNLLISPPFPPTETSIPTIEGTVIPSLQVSPTP
jgi:hypothetical protein